ncbi:MAG: hypothetical protein M5R36_09165 [Deltaproteobacteria bacterium]|nr:hypothetical protein [Deltaproteobacteria bacterium]
MVKWVLRHLIAACMIPVGVFLGVCGFFQNRIRGKRYAEKHEEMKRRLNATEGKGA